MNRLLLFSFVLLYPLFSSDVFSKSESDKIEIYSRCEFSFKNESWSDNPFDLEFNAEFISPTGRVVKQIGFYAGNNEWKLFSCLMRLGNGDTKLHLLMLT